MRAVFDGARKDFRFASRQLIRRPAFTLIAISVLALGLGANAAIFSVVNAILLRPLPFPHPKKLVALFEKDVIPNDPYNWAAPGNYLDWRNQSTSFESIAATTPRSFNLSSPSRSFTPVRVPGALCSANLFQTLGVSPVLGRTFRKDEDSPSAPYLAVIGYGLWQQRFAGSPDVIHRQIRLDGRNYGIIGVMPAGFAYPERNGEVWITVQRELSPFRMASHSNHGLLVIGRLRPGIGIGHAQSEIDTITRRYKRDHPAEVMGKGANVVRLDWYLVRDIKTSLLILLASVACVLLIACVNIANLLLTRAVGRQRELAIRAAVGASRTQIVRQLLIESTTLSLAGAAVGLVLASWASSLLAAHAPAGNSLPQAGAIHVDHSVLLFTLALSVVTGIVAGLFPAFTASRVDLVNNLKDGSRTSTAGRPHTALRDVFVGIEVAASLVLLIAAGLLLRSFSKIEAVRPGIRVQHTLSLAVNLPEAHYQTRAQVATFARQLAERIDNLPGIRSAGLVDCVPLDGPCNDNVFHILGHPLPPGQMMDLLERYADPGYFKAAGIPLSRGRLFTPEDNQGFDDLHPHLDPVLISESAAHTYFGSLDPIGQRLAVGTDAGALPPDPRHPSPQYQVVGIVGDVLSSVDEPVQGAIYMPLLDGYAREIEVVVHTTGQPRSVAAVVRRAINRLDPDLPVHDVRTIGQIESESISARQFSLVLLALFAGLALVLAAIGLYGVVSYAVSQRTPEIGIRMALGAARGEISRMVLLQGMKPALTGVVIGLTGAFLATRTLQSMLFALAQPTR
jgi:predicted permease